MIRVLTQNERIERNISADALFGVIINNSSCYEYYLGNTTLSTPGTFNRSLDISSMSVYHDPTGTLTPQDFWYHLQDNYWLFYNPRINVRHDNAYTIINGEKYYVIRAPGRIEVVRFVKQASQELVEKPDGRMHRYCVRRYGMPRQERLYPNQPTFRSHVNKSKFTLTYSDKKISVFDVTTATHVGIYFSKKGKLVKWSKSSRGWRSSFLDSNYDAILQSWLFNRSKYGTNYRKYKVRTTKLVNGYPNWLSKQHPILNDAGVDPSFYNELKIIPLMDSLREYSFFFIGTKSRSAVRRFVSCKSKADIAGLELAYKSKHVVTDELVKITSKSIPEFVSLEFLNALPTNFRWETALESISYPFQRNVTSDMRVVNNFTDSARMFKELLIKPNITCVTTENLHAQLLELTLRQASGEGVSYHTVFSVKDLDTGLTLRAPASTSEVKLWGILQKHCIGSYASTTDVVLLEVKHPDFPVAHCSLTKSGRGYQPTQIYHRQNTSPDAVLCAMVLETLLKCKVILTKSWWMSRVDESPYIDIGICSSFTPRECPFVPQEMVYLHTGEVFKEKTKAYPNPFE